MRVAVGVSFRFWCLLAAVLVAAPAWSQSLGQALSHGQQQPSRQQIEGFCGNWGQLSNSERKQYRDQYERYCRDEPVFGRPVAPRPQTNILQPAEPEQQQPRQQPQQQPQKPATPEKPAEPEPAEPEPQVQPAKPEPVTPEPASRRVDLVGELRLTGPLAREPGERQRLRVIVENRGPDAPRGNRLWTRVFLSERQVSGRGASSFSLPAVQKGRPLRLPGVPGPGRSREVTTEVTVPAGMPDGNYWWCVRVDTRRQVEETDEGNNTACARKVVALGGESESDLSNVFGSKVTQLGQDSAADQPTQKPMTSRLAETLPAEIQPLMDETPRLFVQGRMDSVGVPEGESATVSWFFPPDSDADELYLRLERETSGDIAPCPAAGTTRAAGADALQARPRSERVWQVDDFYSVDRGALNVSPDYLSVGKFCTLQACGVNGDRFTGEATNRVTVAYASGAWVLLPPGFAFDLFEHLYIPRIRIHDVHVLESSSGDLDTRGRVFVAVDAEVGGDRSTFRSWFESREEELSEAGETGKVYPFAYWVRIRYEDEGDWRTVKAGRHSVPRSGRRWLVVPDYRADMSVRQVRVEVLALAGAENRDQYTTRVYYRPNQTVTVRASRFEVLQGGEGGRLDGKGKGELNSVLLRLENALARSTTKVRERVWQTVSCDRTDRQMRVISHDGSRRNYQNCGSGDLTTQHATGGDEVQIDDWDGADYPLRATVPAGTRLRIVVNGHEFDEASKRLGEDGWKTEDGYWNFHFDVPLVDEGPCRTWPVVGGASVADLNGHVSESGGGTRLKPLDGQLVVCPG